MASKKHARKEFDWRSYSRPTRILDDQQEAALSQGHLAPLLEYAASHPDLTLLIRARQATLYYLGVSLVRMRASEDGPVGEIDANLRAPRAERSASELIESFPLRDAGDVASLIRTLDSLREDLDRWNANGEPSPAREHLLRFYADNRGREAESGELLVLDVEYPYGRGRFDFVALRRAVSVGGTGAFTTPRLVLGDLRYPGRTLGGSARMSDFASSASELAHALSGEHLERVKAEIGLLLRQKQRLGLLRTDIPFERFADGDPELLVVFSDPDVVDAKFDAPVAELHDKLIAKRFPADRLAFAAVGEARENAESADRVDLTVREADVFDYRAFKGMRKRRRG